MDAPRSGRDCGQVKRLTRMASAFENLPLVQHVRELRRITGGSLTCGWMDDEQTFLLYSLVKWYKPDLVVQTGHLWGKSILIVLEGLTDGFLNQGTRIEDQPQRSDRRYNDFAETNAPRLSAAPKVISIDPSPIDVPDSDAGLAYLNEKFPNFEFFRETSSAFFDAHLAELRAEYRGRRILGIIDGDHSRVGCWMDLDNMARLGAQIVLVDDTMWLPYIGRLVRLNGWRHGYKFIDLSLYNGLAILVRKGLEENRSAPNGIADERAVLRWRDIVYLLAYLLMRRRGFAVMGKVEGTIRRLRGRGQ